MSIFHLFPCLPFELRASIWGFTVEPRVVEVRVVPEDSYLSKAKKLMSSTPVPAILHTCREVRNLGLYKQAFSELHIANVNAATEADSRYIWLNLDIDMISIGETHLSYFAPVALSIKRLKLKRENSNESYYYFESHELVNWENTEEIHVVCQDGMEAWLQGSYEHWWPCPQDNLWFIDPDDGRMMKSFDMENMLDAWLHEIRRQNGWDFEEYPETDYKLSHYQSSH